MATNAEQALASDDFSNALLAMSDPECRRLWAYEDGSAIVAYGVLPGQRRAFATLAQAQEATGTIWDSLHEVGTPYAAVAELIREANRWASVEFTSLSAGYRFAINGVAAEGLSVFEAWNSAFDAWRAKSENPSGVVTQ